MAGFSEQAATSENKLNETTGKVGADGMCRSAMTIVMTILPLPLLSLSIVFVANNVRFDRRVTKSRGKTTSLQ